MKVTTTDKIVLENIKELDLRSVVGISKYNRTLEENDFDNPIRHALEESLDLANYLRWILDKKMYSLSEIMEVIRILNTNVSEHTVESLLNNLRAEKRKSVLEELKGEE